MFFVLMIIYFYEILESAILSSRDDLPFSQSAKIIELSATCYSIILNRVIADRSGLAFK